MTTAETICPGCDPIKSVAELMLYRHGMGAILRCAGCDVALMRITNIRGRYQLNLSEMSSLQIAANIQKRTNLH